MQLTIDSSEQLDRVLEVVGSMFGVRLALAGKPGSASDGAPSRSGPAKPKSRAAGVSGGSRRNARTSAKVATAAKVRTWAREAGLAVGERGRMPQSVWDAFYAEH